jgi:hypothetical protein
VALIGKLPTHCESSAIMAVIKSPLLSRKSTSLLSFSYQDVDGRDEPGRDSGEMVQHDRKPLGLPYLPVLMNSRI